MKHQILAVVPVLMSRDVGAALAFYRKLGFAPVFQDAPRSRATPASIARA